MKTKVVDRKKKHPRGCQCNTCDRRRTRRGVRAVISAYVHARDGDECQFHLRLKKLKRISPCVCGGKGNACHKIPVADSHALEYDERNLFWGCSWSNRWAALNRESWKKLWPGLFPEDAEYLQSNAKVLTQRKRGDIKAIELYYRQRLEER
jgi:hypothetical protein